MELLKCKNGHSYDPSITPECPDCARLAGHTVPLVSPTSFEPADNIGKTVPIRRDTQPVNPPEINHWAEAPDYLSANYASENYAPTMPVNYDKAGITKKRLSP